MEHLGGEQAANEFRPRVEGGLADRAPAPRAGGASGVLAGGGEMGALMRDRDWSATPVGPVDSWPRSLRATVRLLLDTRQPMLLWWGAELTQFYNDAYCASLGAERHPTALGASGREFWADAWPIIGHEVEAILGGAAATWHQHQLVPIHRNGRLEDVYWTYGYTPVRDEAGAVQGVLATVVETTPEVRERAARTAELEQASRRYQEQAAALEAASARLEEHIDAAARARAAVAESEEKYRTLFTTMDQGFCILQVEFDEAERPVDYRFVEVNPAFARQSGLPEPIGRRAREIVPMLEPFWVEMYGRVATTGEATRFERYAESMGRWFDVHAFRVGEAGERRVALLFTDITARKQAEQERDGLLAAAEVARTEAERARAAAEEAARLKAEFLSTMSHEFRTPLNAILGYGQLLSMGVLGPATTAQHAHLERLLGSARHLLRLVDDVLDVAKADADRLAVRRDPLVTGAAVAAAVALVHPQATAKGVRLRDAGATGPGVRYVGDEHRVRQILVNLLANAVKFTPPGGEVTVVCAAAAEPDPGVFHPEGPESHHRRSDGWAFVRVEDTGPGIAPELGARLFEPFVQGDGALTREQGGTGLGLAISRRLARLMGGDLTVRSRAEGGAAFTLWLPGAAEASAPPPGQPDAHPGRRTPALGTDAIADAERTPLDGAAYAVLHALSVRLAAEAETVAQRYVTALRADERFPGVAELSAVQLRDHATPFVGLLASQLMVVGETHGQAPELLGDGGQVQRLMAELHGAQRHRLGWSEADIERETLLLAHEVEQALRDAVDTDATADGPLGAPARAAVDYAADVVRHVLEQAGRTAVRAYRHAKADAP